MDSAAAGRSRAARQPPNAPVTITVIVAAVGLAVLGGLIAGGFGGWRAARLRPADALSKVA